MIELERIKVFEDSLDLAQSMDELGLQIGYGTENGAGYYLREGAVSLEGLYLHAEALTAHCEQLQKELSWFRSKYPNPYPEELDND